MELDLRKLRWCVIPVALLVCVTMVLWQLSGHERVPSRSPARDTGQTRMNEPGGGSPQVVSSRSGGTMLAGTIGTPTPAATSRAAAPT
jgi:hypothetical protein